MKRRMLVLILAACLCWPAVVLAQGVVGTGEPISMSGTIQGLISTCAGHVCRPGEEYIIAAAEDNFVLLTDSGKYYFLPNLDRAVLARHLNTQVTIAGVVDNKWKTIQVASIMKDGKKVWTATTQEEVDREYRINQY